MPLIVLERTSSWTAAFRREIAKSPRPLPIPIHEVRSLPHCRRELEAAPYSIVAAEVLPRNLAAVAKAISAWSCDFPQARFIALAARGLEQHDLALREYGAIHVTYSPRALASLLRVIRRHLASEPKVEQTLEEAIWTGLPWG